MAQDPRVAQAVTRKKESQNSFNQQNKPADTDLRNVAASFLGGNFARSEEDQARADDISEQQRGSMAQGPGQEFGAGYTAPSFNLFGTPEEIAAAQAGLQQARTLYGTDVFGIGEDVSQLRDLYRTRMEQGGTDPVSAAIMGQKGAAVTTAGRSMRQAGVKGGVAARALGDVAAQKEQEIRESLYGQQRQSAQDFGRLTGNTLSGTVGLMKGEQAGSQVPPQYNPSGLFGMSAICTELYQQGKMPYDVYLADMQYGYKISMERPEVLDGYHLWARPVVKLMRKSELFTNLVKYPALSWANHIAGIKPSFFGSLCQTVGESACGLLGKMLYKVRRLYV